MTQRGLGRVVTRVAVAAALGSVVLSLALLAVQRYVDSSPANLTAYGYATFKVRLVLWPSLLMLMRTSGMESTPMGYAVLAVSLALNAILYAMIAAAVCWIWQSLSALTRRS